MAIHRLRKVVERHRNEISRQIGKLHHYVLDAVKTVFVDGSTGRLFRIETSNQETWCMLDEPFRRDCNRKRVHESYKGCKLKLTRAPNHEEYSFAMIECV